MTSWVYSFYSLQVLCFSTDTDNFYTCFSGRGGEGLKVMTRTTGAKVSCSKERMHYPGAMGTVTIKGTKQEVKQAKVSNIQSFRFVMCAYQ